MPKVKRVLIYGGKSSAKTVSVCQIIAKYGVEENASAILFRKESNRVKLTIKKSFELSIKTTRLDEAWQKQDRLFKGLHGSEIVLTGLDDEEKAKGVEGFSFVLCDELNQFYHKEYKQINWSLRGEGRKVFFGTWNPVSKNSWVKTKLTDTYVWKPTKYVLPNKNSFVKISSCGTTILIKTNYKDNYWSVGSPCGTYGYVDSNLIDDYEAMRKDNFNDYKVNVLGEYGTTDRTGGFYKKFNTEKHVKTHEYNPELPLHISFDENVTPYVSLSIYQGKGMNVWKIKEICLEHPFNTLVDTLKKFRKQYPVNKLYVYIYGDRTSLKADTKLLKGQNFFTIVEDNLKNNGYTTQRRLPRQNPSVHLRGQFINSIFDEELFGITYSVDENCINTIDDYENVKEAPDGTKHKKKVKHPDTGIMYEEYGHLTDTDDYFLCEYFKKEYNKFIKPRGKRRRILT